MSILRNISLFWAMAHTLVLFMMLFESRFSRKKTLVITLSTMIPLIILNGILTFILDADRMATTMLVTLSVPSLIIFFILSKHRDGRFFFTFCLVDTVVLEIIYVTQLLNHFLTPDTYIFMFVVRIAIMPLLEWLTWKKFRATYLHVQNYTQHTWSVFAAISGLFYILITLTAAYPTAITERMEYLPLMILIFTLVPTIYVHIVLTLWRHQSLHEKIMQEDILKLQVSNLSDRIADLSAADEKFRIERHNFRHKMKTIASLVELQQYEELTALVQDYNETYRKTQVVRYCSNAIIDAVLSTYIGQAESKGIQVSVGLAFPEPIPVDETELGTVFANAIENAIHASEKLPKDQRHIEIKVLCQPRFMIMIRNNFNGEIEFDDEGIPVSRAEEHGFGTRSIVAFCNKHDAHYLFKVKDNKFALYLDF